MIASYKTLLPIDKAHADAVDISITIKPITVRLNVIELDVVAIITNVSNDFSIVVIVLYFFDSFLDLLFLSSKYVIISLLLFMWLLKLLTSFIFFSNLCLRLIFFSNGALVYSLSLFYSPYMISIRQIYPCINLFWYCKKLSNLVMLIEPVWNFEKLLLW